MPVQGIPRNAQKTRRLLLVAVATSQSLYAYGPGHFVREITKRVSGIVSQGNGIFSGFLLPDRRRFS
jgi:hypothetical protein